MIEKIFFFLISSTLFQSSIFGFEIQTKTCTKRGNYSEVVNLKKRKKEILMLDLRTKMRPKVRTPLVSQPFSTKLNLALNKISQSLHRISSNIRSVEYYKRLRCNASVEDVEALKAFARFGVWAWLNTYTLDADVLNQRHKPWLKNTLFLCQWNFYFAQTKKEQLRN